jgi:hypothetical protein
MIEFPCQQRLDSDSLMPCRYANRIEDVSWRIAWIGQITFWRRLHGFVAGDIGLRGAIAGDTVSNEGHKVEIVGSCKC